MTERRPLLARFGAAALLVLVLGLALRLYGLNREGASYDEAFSMTACRMQTGAMLQMLVEDFVHPPGSYFVLCGWMNVTGYGVVQARLLSMIFGTLAIAVLFLLADYLFDRRTAILASLLLATSQLGIMLAQDARMYGQFLFLFLSCSYLFIRALHARSIQLWCAFIGVAILMIYTHYFGLLALGAMAVFALVYRRQASVPLAWWAGGAVVLVLSYMPWLTSGVVQAATSSPKTFSGRNEWWSVDAGTFFAAFNFFNNGKPAGLLDSSPLWTFPLGALLFTAPAALAFLVASDRREKQSFWLAALLSALPVLGAIAGGFMKLQYDHRYVAFCAAPYYILVGRGISAIRRDALRMGLLVLLLGYTANSLRANYLMPKREDFRSAAAYIQAHRQPGDCGVFLPRFRVPLQWGIELQDAILFRVLDGTTYPSQMGACGRIWAVSWSLGGNNFQWARAKTELAKMDPTHTLVDEQHYTWVRVALYSRK